MADEQETSNDAGDEGEIGDYDGNDITDTNDIIATTTQPAPIINDAASTSTGGDYDDDEPLPDVTVKLYIKDDDGPFPNDVIEAGITDIYGNPVTGRPGIDGYTTYDNTTAIAGKGFWGTWNWNKALFTILIGLCIIGIILAVVYMIIGKRFKKNKRAPPAATTTTTTQAAATRGISPKQEYSPVPTSV